MEIRDLKYFLAVVSEQNITKAAEKLYISQPSLSKQIKNLEDEIGKPLLIRGSRKIALTEAGETLKARAEEIIALYNKACAELNNPTENLSGLITIGCGESYSLRTVTDTAFNLHKLHPNVKFEFFSGDAVSVLERLDKGLIDFGVLIDANDVSGYNYLELPYGDYWGVFMPKNCPLAKKPYLTVADLKKLPLIMSRQAYIKGSRLYNWFGADINDITIAAKYNLLYNATLLVRAGMGFAVSIENIVNTQSGDIAFIKLYPEIKTKLTVVWKKFGVLTKPAQLFLSMLKDEIKNCNGETSD